MKKPKAARKALRAKKYEQKLTSSGSFQDMLEASAAHVRKMEKRKAAASVHKADKGKSTEKKYFRTTL
jgi:hypothetical protein